MFKKTILILAILFVSGFYAQEIKSLYKLKKILVSRDSIKIEKKSINKSFFKITDSNSQSIDTSFYFVNYQKGVLIFKEKAFYLKDSLTLRYLNFPDFLTKKYSIYDADQVLENNISNSNLYKVANNSERNFTPFEGLNTSGSITRGITVGNNQNSVINSALDLQITGKISDKISLRASIQDSNIPLQQGGYSQKLDEFDQIFIEFFSDKWFVRAGDLFLENRKSKFLNFNKKVQGLVANFDFGTPEKKTTVFGSVSLVRGQYAKTTFVGQEGNQGPYKLRGQNGALFVLVVSGSERVFVNGILLKRGENNDYTIDYNAGEIIFTSLFPISSEMRINIEYQYSDRSFTRFVTYAGATHEQKKWSLSGNLYAETDQKNQPLQQTLSADQVQTLSKAGDNPNLMNASSAFLDTFSANKILYKKVVVNGNQVFEYSIVPTDELFNVKFSLLGNNLGNYILLNSNAIGKIYQYKTPVNGVLQGNYEPVSQLIAPTKIQIATIMGRYNPTEKTALDFELGISNNDKNLFSSLDDNDNQGVAGKLNFKQRLISKKWHVDFLGNYQFVQQDFQTIERLFTIEFDRDWNLSNIAGNQNLLVSGISFQLPSVANIAYQFERLNFSKSFDGTRHVLNANYKTQKWHIQTSGSFLLSEDNLSTSKFLRNQTLAKFNFKKNWIGSSFRTENNEQKNKLLNQFSALSQRFLEVGAFVGRGDSTKVFVELGYLRRKNDSLQNGLLNRVNVSDTYYLKSKLIQNQRSDLSIFINYRNLNFENSIKQSEPSLNSRILYNSQFLNQMLQISTAYENTSGSIAQQEFSYIEVDSGRGIYTWIDYNQNGIQELEEFEVAKFSDQAKFIRIFLPNQIFLKTHQNKFSQSLVLNFSQWQNKTGLMKITSYFYNQTSFLAERKIARVGNNFDFNPFESSQNNLLGVNKSFRNSLFYNRGKQNHSITHTYIFGQTKNLLTTGTIESKNRTHQIQYAHLIQKTWLLTFISTIGNSSALSENYGAKNFEIDANQLEPKISYLFDKNASLDLFYEMKNKKNNIGDLETLNQSRFGTSFNYSNENQFTINGEFSFYQNKFKGNEFSPVAFQMLEGLQSGQNLSWRLLIQKKLTNFLDVNLNYEGRKNEINKAVHVGNIQLRAFF
jgi:hypothetical protein